MKRHQLFEFNDLSWWPNGFRGLLTDYLRTCFEITRPFAPKYSLIAEAMRAAQTDQAVDLGSGTGGPWLDMVNDLCEVAGKPVTVVLTDKFPDPDMVRRLEGARGVAYWPEPVDARAVPRALTGLRTLFDSFHHFSRGDACTILRDAVRQNEPIAVFENLRHSWLHLIGVVFVPFVVLALTPWIRPRSWRRLALTYLIPIAPLVITWDAAVSVLRCYSPKELTAMAHEVAGDSYVWKAGEYHKGVMPVTYLVGYPRR